MRIARLTTSRGPCYATWTDDGWALIEDWTGGATVPTGDVIAHDRARLLPPVDPRVLVGIAHNKSLNNHPLPIQAWHKSLRSIAGPHDRIHARRGIGTVNIEGELAAVMGRDTEGITVANALDYVIGWTIANDVTNVDRNPIDEKTFQGKGGIGYTPLGPWVETELDDPDDVPITVTINGEIRAVSGTTYLPSTIAESIVYVADWVPLGAGDVVMTGAPNTAVPVKPTDIVEITIDRIGSLTSEVV